MTTFWSTANESNNSFFTIERSANGSNFSPIATIDGAGNSAEQIDYAYTDSNPLKGFNFYRLKQTDLNGNFEYSAIVLVDFIGKPGQIARLYPNPVKQRETIYINYFSAREQQAQVSIINNKGQRFLYQSILLSDGDNDLTIETANLQKGIYLLRLAEYAGGTKTFKVIIH